MIYLKCEPAVLLLAMQMMEKYHQDLVALGVTLECLYVFDDRDADGNPQGSALERHGDPADATIRITKLKERVAGRRDAEILLDGPMWPKWTKPQKLALLDHEITHLEAILDHESGEPKLDDHGRPRLKSKPHDIAVGWFLIIAERHKEASHEVIQARHILKHNKKGLML